MTHTFDPTSGSFPSLDLSNAVIDGFSMNGVDYKAGSMRDVCLSTVRELYKVNKWPMREAMIKKHGFLQAYFYQDVIDAKNPLKVIDNIYMREISQERAYDLLIRTLSYMKVEDFSIDTK